MPLRTRIKVSSIGPFDLALSLAAMASFAPPAIAQNGEARAALRLGRRLAIVEYRQTSIEPAVIEFSTEENLDRAALKREAAWLIAAELDLRSFYTVVAKHPIFAPLTRSLYGLKPMRPSSLFEMAVTAITEQQISLIAAYHIRQRLIERFGRFSSGMWIFPSAQALADASSRALLACGLSHRKAEYIIALARGVTQGKSDLDTLRQMPDDAAREMICQWRGFGPWSANYILVRGLGRMDCIPLEDIGVRSVVGMYLGDGKRASPSSVAKLLRPFAPFRGLAIFYLLAAHRMHCLGAGDLQPAD